MSNEALYEHKGKLFAGRQEKDRIIDIQSINISYETSKCILIQPLPTFKNNNLIIKIGSYENI